jgi:DNA-binding response OmpR family regulator
MRAGADDYLDKPINLTQLEIRLAAIERALYSLPRGQQDAVRVQFDDLSRLEAAYSRTRPSSDDQAYLERRLGELEVQARVRR